MRHSNFDALAVTPLRTDALAIVETGYTAIDIGSAITQRLRIENDALHVDDAAYPIGGRRVFFIGIGKCAFVAAEAVEKLLGDQLTAGIALDVSADVESRVQSIETYVGTHPLPSTANERASARIVNLLSACREDDFVLMLISGGGSTLLCLPEAPMTYLDEGKLFTDLSAKGATIQEMNTVRKHTSRARGGWLAQAAHPAQVVSLIVSDVPGNDIEFISSGPSVRDTSTVADAREVLVRYAIPTLATLTLLETPKDAKYFEHVTNTLFLTNSHALEAMRTEAERRGYTATIMNDHVSGEAHRVGRGIVQTLHSTAPKTVLLYAGETTVSLDESPLMPRGTGGRNQEMALAALPEVHDDELFLPFASDGHDNTDHAGAIADTLTRAHGEAQHLSVEDSLSSHNSYDFFTTTGDALVTGYTGSNVSDIIIAIKN